jgi:hypothetical protein
MTTDLLLNKRSKIASYRTLLQSFIDGGFTFFTHAEYFRNGPYEGKAMYLRHDADRNIETALVMARIEHELGIRSTFYLLPPGDYDQTENYYGAIRAGKIVMGERLKQVATDIAALGHEIGLHNDFVQLSGKLGCPIEQVIADQISSFKSIGIEIAGTASHGSNFVKQHGFTNYQIFSECRNGRSVARTIELPGRPPLELFSVSYQKLGLEYEAYSVRRDMYLSDSSGVFTVNKQAVEVVEPAALAEQLAGSRAVVTLLHPDWWAPPQPVFVQLLKKSGIMAGSRQARRLFNDLPLLIPGVRRTRALERQVISLRGKNEKLAALLEEQKEKTRALYKRNKEYAQRLNSRLAAGVTQKNADRARLPGVDYCLNAHSKVASYRGLLQAFLSAGFTSCTHYEGARNVAATGKSLYLRHDVDHDLETALGMARLENGLGIKASYFFLPPGDYEKSENYYGALVGNRIVHSERFRKVVTEIYALGHEVGLHNDFLQLSARLGREVADLLAGEIAYLKGLGIPVHGTASHGSGFSRKQKFVNYDIFAQCRKNNSVSKTIALEGGREFTLFTVDMADLNLAYEAYHIARDTYIADTGSRMTLNKVELQDIAPQRLVDEIADRRRVVVLIHPEWWHLKDEVQHIPGELVFN